jgi:hypothetical protein
MSDLDVTSYAPDEHIPEPWEKPFFEAFINEYGVIGKACDAAGIHENVVRTRTKNSKTFKMMYESAVRMVNDMLEYESMRRALEPNERPVFQRGQLVGIIKEWDTKHLEWVMERRMPEKYHIPTRVEFAGDGEGVLNFKLELNPGSSQDDAEDS